MQLGLEESCIFQRNGIAFTANKPKSSAWLAVHLLIKTAHWHLTESKFHNKPFSVSTPLKWSDKNQKVGTEVRDLCINSHAVIFLLVFILY